MSNYGLRLAILSLAACLCFVSASVAEDLPSWNDGPARQAILNFVAETTTPGSPNFVPPAERIATFDQDGTLWVEQPIYTQVRFAVDRLKTLAAKHPEWREKEPFRAILTGNQAALDEFSLQDFEQVVVASHSGLSVEEFRRIVAEWLATARHPRFNRPYTECVYQPMLELLAYLRGREFKTYIVTGGGQEFVRVYAERVYGIPPEQIVGTTGKVQYQYQPDGQPELLKLPAALFVDDKGGKPAGIHYDIGRRPVAAFGNSTGDREMLEWTQAGGNPRLMMLVHHDDAEREYAYGADSKIGTFSLELLTEATTRGWVVISMKHDWRRIFPFDAEPSPRPTR